MAILNFFLPSIFDAQAYNEFNEGKIEKYFKRDKGNIINFARNVPTNSYLQPNLFFRTPGGGLGGKFTNAGKIITFWYK